MKSGGSTNIKLNLGVIRAPAPIGIELKSPVADKLRGYVDENLKTRPLIVSAADTYKGKTLALCGAGPSLRDADFNGCDYTFACNSALTYLWDKGVDVTAGVGIDQTPGLMEEWMDPPPVPYYVASSCDPALIKHLREHDRQCIFFHNFVGLMDEDGNSDEMAYYSATWPTMFMVAQGFTVVGRFLGVAQWMGFERIDIYGADHAFLSTAERGSPAGKLDIAHANGDTAGVAYGRPILYEGEIDGRVWRTRPDMLLAAVFLAKRARDSGGTIRLMGDTLPNALLDKDDKYLDQICRALGPDELEAGEINTNYGVE